MTKRYLTLQLKWLVLGALLAVPALAGNPCRRGPTCPLRQCTLDRITCPIILRDLEKIAHRRVICAVAKEDQGACPR